MSRSVDTNQGQRGSALIAVLILGFAVAGGAAVLGRATYELAAELRVRREALCARYAALAGLALGPSIADQAPTVGEAVESLSVAYVRRSAVWCVTRSLARCGDAQRVMERTAPLAACGG